MEKRSWQEEKAEREKDILVVHSPTYGQGVDEAERVVKALGKDIPEPREGRKGL